MSAAHILVADDDVWILRMIQTVLERRGHRVTLASDGEEALRSAAASNPDLIITDINMPRMDGWDLIGALRNRDGLGDVPVIILSEMQDEDSRVRGYKLGVEDFIAKPFRFEELDLRVARILERTASATEPAPVQADDSLTGGTFGLVGTLEQVGLSSLLTLLELDRKTGVLTLSRDNGGALEEARIHISGGRCHAAELTGRESPRDAACVHGLLEWSGGSFAFNQQPIETPDRIGQSTTSLLLEAARLADERDR